MENGLSFWAKTDEDGNPGISVLSHCLNVGFVAEVLLAAMHPRVRALLPPGTATLTALHDVGKITLGFQAKCERWLQCSGLGERERKEARLSTTDNVLSDHALFSQLCVQELLESVGAGLWSVALGAHHGRPKGRRIKLPRAESCGNLIRDQRKQLAEELIRHFGPLPTQAPQQNLDTTYPAIWLLAGLTTVADWIGSNEAFFLAQTAVSKEQAGKLARAAVQSIGLPGGALRKTSFQDAFFPENTAPIMPNPVQIAAAEAASKPGIIIIEGPMGCGKTEAALYAAQQLIASGQQHGIYFALPTQVTSNRIHERVGRFLHNTLEDTAQYRLIHGNAWLQDRFNLRLRPSFQTRNSTSQASVQETYSWFTPSKHALLAPYGVGTVDQALQSVVTVKHFFVRRFALAGKVVILDEVHSYDIYTGALIKALIRELIQLQCTVIVLSATLTADQRRDLLAAGDVKESEQHTTYPLITFGAPGTIAESRKPVWPDARTVTIRAEPISEEQTLDALITRAEKGEHVLWIRNTVIEAQHAFRALLATMRESEIRTGLLHGRFPFHRREDLETEWLGRLGKNRTEGSGSILIATQVVEQSVDIDLDFIVTDLAPTDMILQRTGRLWRHPRSHRVALKPELWIRIAPGIEDGDADRLKKALGRSAHVYAPYVLLRTSRVFVGKALLSLPNDIRPLLETTYTPSPSDEPAAWGQLRDELSSEKALLEQNAQAAMLVLGRPMLDDTHEVLTRRKGAPTIPVVLLRALTQTGAGQFELTALDGSSVSISEHNWQIGAARFLHQWMVRAPKWMVPRVSAPLWLTMHLSDDAVPAFVQESDGNCSFDDSPSTMFYDPRLGIYAERPAKPTPQWNDDDEFDN